MRASRPRPLGDHQGDDAEDERQRGHDDRPEPDLGGFQGGLIAGTPSLLAVAGELDDQDRVLAGQARQHDEADLDEDVDVHPGHRDPGQGAQQAHRHDQDHRQRQRPTLVETGEHEEDEQGPPCANALKGFCWRSRNFSILLACFCKKLSSVHS